MAEMPSTVEFDVYLVPKGARLNTSHAGLVKLGTVTVEPHAVEAGNVAEQVTELLQEQTDGVVAERITGTGIREVPS